MEPGILRPEAIESRSMEIIESELGGCDLAEPYRSVLKRVIHTSADFDYKENLVWSEEAAEKAVRALEKGVTIVTDTNMALAGINKPGLEKLGSRACCFMSDPEVAREAKERGVTRAAVSMERSAELGEDLIYAIGNAPTALITLERLFREGKISPLLVIAVPVGFVNVVEAKELIISSGMPYIAAKGRKGGSNIAAAICNALIYSITRKKNK